MLYGTGKYTYELVDGWAKLPEGYSFGDVGSLSIDSQDRVYVLNRGAHPVMVFDREGNLLTTWGEGFFTKRAHGSCVGPDDSVYCTDDGNHTVSKFTPEGTLLFSWGEPGSAPGQFRLPHSVWVDKQERVWVVDRENSRIQVFNGQGEFLSQWTDLSRPTDVFIDNDETVYVSELRPARRVSIFAIDGKLLAQWGSEGQDEQTAVFLAPHAIAVDSWGDIYVGEVPTHFAGVDRRARTMQKFVRKT